MTNYYNEYIASGHWKHLCKVHKKNKCFCCQYTKNLELHHTTYKNLGNELPTDFITVCKRCHNKIHTLVKNNKCILDNAHFFLKKRISKFGVDKKKKLANNWRKLLNKSKKETISDLESFLIEKGLLSNGKATKKAFELKFAYIENKQTVWCVDKYIKMMKAHKKVVKNIKNNKKNHPKILEVSLYE